MEEVWKDIKGFERLYQISNLGRVKSLPKWMGSYYSKERILKNKLDRYGYHKVTLCNGEQIRKYTTVHRLVAEAFIPNSNNLSTVNHKDGNKLNNTVSNLEWASNKENIDHAWKNGLKELTRDVASITHGHKCTLISICDGERFSFSSKQKASLFLGYNGHWLSSAIKENTNYEKACLNKGYKISFGGDVR